ncbi:hypothetical protein [Janthinobacterium sp. YR213]|uniref:hypothetical protein n=1 Tax=Janthinobacterium sp. YR213 TaxID=1881027 RepID=UPI000B8385E6|nr:hypothetical protein [Janthinobacterium sp. YR213]
MSLKSIQAIQACMSFLGLRLDQPYHEAIYCTFSKLGGSAGLMQVVFNNDVHAHQGPYLTFDDTIRGFGIQYQEFKPAYQQFAFKKDGEQGVLTCKGNGYQFSMRFSLAEE